MKIVDHLFRHQYGKMVSILIRIFGISQIELIEEAIQETFLKAMVLWRQKTPENPEAWLTYVAKNKVIDILRQKTTTQDKQEQLGNEFSLSRVGEAFEESEAEDSQLKLIFVACHPALKEEDQLAFALRTLAGFSIKEIATALLSNEQTIKKRFLRARKTIIEKNLPFELPQEANIKERMVPVLRVLYLIFNEGFHSASNTQMIREDLCGEGLRLCKILLKNHAYRGGSLYSLFSLMCLNSARLRSKVNSNNEIIDLKNQDRSLWYQPLIKLGMDALWKSEEFQEISPYYYEAKIAEIHLRSDCFKNTDWEKILHYYEQLYTLQPSPMILLNKALVNLQLGEFKNCYTILESISSKSLGYRSYILYGSYAEYYFAIGKKNRAKKYLEQALSVLTNQYEKEYIEQKLKGIT